MPSKKEKVNVELYPYDDFSLMDDEEAFRELCSTLNFDVFDDSITSEDILRRKREINIQSGDFVRNNHNHSQSQNNLNNINPNVNDNNSSNNYVYGSLPTTLPPGSYYPYPGPPIQNFLNENINNNTYDTINGSNYPNNAVNNNNPYYPIHYSSSENALHPNPNHTLYPLQTPYHPSNSMSLSNSDTLTVSSSSSDHMSIASSLSIDPNTLSFSYNAISNSNTNNKNSNSIQTNNNNIVTNTINVHSSSNNSHTNSNDNSHNNTPRTQLSPPQHPQPQQQQQQQQFNPHKARKIVRSLIPSDDIRRKYARLFTEAFNSTGIEELRVLLNLYALPSCVAIYKYVGNPNPLYGPVYCELKGIEAISNYWKAIFGAVPDCVYEMQENKLRVLANPAHIQNIANNINRSSTDNTTNHGSGSSSNGGNAAPVAIVMKFIFSGTKIYRISADNHANVVYSDTTAAAKTTTTSDNNHKFSSSNNTDITNNNMYNNSSYTIENERSAHALPSSSLLKHEPSSMVAEDSTATSITTSNNTTAEAPIIQKFTHQIGLDGCLEKSAPFIFLGTMTFFTGSDKKIYKIEVVYCVRSE